jgi:hypothetical protein
MNLAGGLHSAGITYPGFRRHTVRINSDGPTTRIVGLEPGRLTDPRRFPFQVRVSPQFLLGELNVVILKSVYAAQESQVGISAARTGRIIAGDFLGTMVAILVVDGEVRFTGAFDLDHGVHGIELTPEGVTPLPRPSTHIPPTEQFP